MFLTKFIACGQNCYVQNLTKQMQVFETKYEIFMEDSLNELPPVDVKIV